jgi:tRNA pseudouridine32 synthase/23S rRNA pseudouridine746 synthase
MSEIFQITVVDVAVSAVDLLADESSLSKQLIKTAMQKGAVWLKRKGKAQRLRRAKKSLLAGDQLYFYYNPEVLSEQITAPELIADEGAYSIWYKPYGVYSQGSKWGDHCTIYRYAETYLQPQRPALVVHRLDRAASGLIVLAHKRSVAAAFSALFEQRGLEKEYLVKVWGDFSELNQPVVIDRAIDGKSSLSLAQCLGTAHQQSLLRVKIASGRKHQIRRHLSEIGFPVVGDRLYGRGDRGEDLQLVAYHLAFDCPVSGEPKEYCLPQSLRPSL